MKTIISTLCLFLLLTVASTAMAQSPSLTLTQEKNGVRLKAQDVTLIDLLIAIQQKSGIRFDLPEEMDSTPVSFHLLEADWRALVSTVMDDFNKIEVWSDDPGKSYVKVMGIGDYIPYASTNPKPQVLAKNTPVPQQATRQERAPRKQALQKSAPQESAQEKIDRKEEMSNMRERVFAARAKAEKERLEREYVDPNHPLAKLPDHIFMEPAILDYLIKSNVDIPSGLIAKYGLDREDGGMRTQKLYPIMPEIYNDPSFETYLRTVGLPKPPQFPENN